MVETGCCRTERGLRKQLEQRRPEREPERRLEPGGQGGQPVQWVRLGLGRRGSLDRRSCLEHQRDQRVRRGLVHLGSH